MKTRRGVNDVRRCFDAIQHDDDSKQRYVGILVKQCVAYMRMGSPGGLTFVFGRDVADQPCPPVRNCTKPPLVVA